MRSDKHYASRQETKVKPVTHPSRLSSQLLPATALQLPAAALATVLQRTLEASDL